MVNEAEAAIGFWKNLAGDEACAAALREDAGDRAHGCPETEAADRHGTVFWIDAEIGGGADFSPTSALHAACAALEAERDALAERADLSGRIRAMAAGEHINVTEGRAVLHMALYAVVLLGVSVLVSQVVPNSLMGVIGTIYGESAGQAAPILILMFINIHHYFTDGVLWKISNPEVRKDLFAHVARS
jgi:hypothetical protein